MTHPMIAHDAKELAGAFYDEERSETFRITWPSQDEYVAVKWPHFVEGVRQGYAALLAQHGVSEEDKERIYEALIADAPAAQGMRAQSPLPLFKGTQAFEGDRRENFATKESFGRHQQGLKARLRSTAALFNN